jgi:hypothetical protein
MSVTITTSRGTLTLEIGREYIIEPLNPKKLKNRGRHCLLLDFIPVSDSHPRDIQAKIRYLDNNRIGRAELGDLIE